jgi:hypothetical protein
VFVNAERADVPAGVSVLEALRHWSADVAREAEAGSRQVMDSRGLPVALDAPVYAGAIFRLVAARGSGDDLGDDLD